MSETNGIEIPDGATVGSAGDPASPQPRDGDRVIVLERPTWPGESLGTGQTGTVETRPLMNWRGRPATAQGCPWVKVDDPSPRLTAANGGRVLAKRWAILASEGEEQP